MTESEDDVWENMIKYVGLKHNCDMHKSLEVLPAFLFFCSRFSLLFSLSLSLFHFRFEMSHDMKGRRESTCTALTKRV